MAVVDIVWYTYRGEDDEEIPYEATHIFVLAKVFPVHIFQYHDNIQLVIFHKGVEKIERGTFYCCHSLRRVIMPGVKIVEEYAFHACEALEDVKCGMLEIIEERAFVWCRSLKSINLPSARIVGKAAFLGCNLVEVKFGKNLERIEGKVFDYCTALERITIPLKDDIITADDTFQLCENLKYVDLVEGQELHETIAASIFEDWRNDMYEEIDSINRILPTAYAGYDGDSDEDCGEKARAIRRWIESVIFKIDHYTAKRQQVMDVAAATLQLDLPQEIVMNNIFPFLALPSHILDGEIHQEVEVDGVDEERVNEHECNEAGQSDNLEEDVEERESDHEGNVSPPGIILIEILLFYWLVVWGSFSLMRGMPFASPVLVSALAVWQVRK